MVISKDLDVECNYCREIIHQSEAYNNTTISINYGVKKIENYETIDLKVICCEECLKEFILKIKEEVEDCD